MHHCLLDLVHASEPEAGPALRTTEEVAFANGEIKTMVRENIRGDDVYVIQCMDDPLSERSVNDNFMALLTAVNAVYQSDPDSITAVIPQFPYSRQERKKGREAITARLVAAALEEAGANRVITLDIHAEAIEGFFRRAILEDLHASKEIISYFRTILPRDCEEELVVVAPDTGGAHMARHYSMVFNCGFAVVDKARDYSRASVVESMRLVGDVNGKRVILPDDLIATGGTLINACRLLRDQGAREIYVACSLPFFNGPAVEKLDKAYAEGLFQMVLGTDAVWRGQQFATEHPWYREVSVANLFARVIFNINRRRSVSELLK
jgi:ribose-phosphate pyrophosphokinase